MGRATDAPVYGGQSVMGSPPLASHLSAFFQAAATTPIRWLISRIWIPTNWFGCAAELNNIRLRPRIMGTTILGRLSTNQWNLELYTSVVSSSVQFRTEEHTGYTCTGPRHTTTYSNLATAVWVVCRKFFSYFMGSPASLIHSASVASHTVSPWLWKTP